MKLIKGNCNKLDMEPFDNEQMLLNLFDILEEIDLKITKGKIGLENEIVITYKNRIIPIDTSLVKFAYAYKRLEKTYRLEAKMLIDLILSKNVNNEHISEFDIINLFYEIRKEHKVQKKNNAFKKRIVWLKNKEITEEQLKSENLSVFKNESSKAQEYKNYLEKIQLELPCVSKTPKPTKEQMKKALRKILLYQKNEKEPQKEFGLKSHETIMKETK